MNRRKLLSVLALVSSLLMYQNCGQTPLGGLDLGSSSDNSSNSNSDEQNVVVVPYALLSAEQVYKSMASVTGIEPNNTIRDEFNSRATLMGSGYDLKLITSPMMIGVSNVGSRFCEAVVNNERNQQPAVGRRFFPMVDFSKAVSALNEESYKDSLSRLSVAFWGRSPTTEEVQLLESSRQEFVAELTQAEASNATSTRGLMLFTCTAMLASFDTLTF